MNDYITLDGKQYKAVFGQFQPIRSKPARVRKVLSGSTNVTYGPAVTVGWKGPLIVPTVASGSSWGTVDDLRTTYDKMVAVPMVDHYSQSYNVAIVEDLQEQSLSPAWDGAENRIMMLVTLVRI